MTKDERAVRKEKKNQFPISFLYHISPFRLFISSWLIRYSSSNYVGSHSVPRHYVALAIPLSTCFHLCSSSPSIICYQGVSCQLSAISYPRGQVIHQVWSRTWRTTFWLSSSTHYCSSCMVQRQLDRIYSPCIPTLQRPALAIKLFAASFASALSHSPNQC